MTAATACEILYRLARELGHKAYHGALLYFIGNMAMLTAEQRAELEKLGSETVRTKLIQPGAGYGASLAGFKSGNLTRGDVDEWLAEKSIAEADLKNSTLRWAKIAGWAGIISVVATTLLGIATIVVTILLAK